jgi:hypothetical protein
MTRREPLDATINVLVTQRMKIALEQVASDDMTTTSELARRAIHHYAISKYPKYLAYIESAKQELSQVLKGEK